MGSNCYYQDHNYHVYSKTKLMKLKLLVIIFLIAFPIVAHGDYKKEIDSLIEASYNKQIEIQYVESLKLANKALQLSLGKEYSKGISYSYLYIAKGLQEFGLKMDAMKYIAKVEAEKYSSKDASIQSEIYHLKGRIASSQQLYTLEKDYYLKQLKVSVKIKDPKKKKLSIISAYFYLQHLYVKQNNHDSALIYQNFLEKYLNDCHEGFADYYYSSLYADRALLYINDGKFDKAAEQLDKSLKVTEDSNKFFLLYSLQIYGDLEIARGDTVKAIAYYKRALENSTKLSINHKSMYLHKKISEFSMNNELTEVEAKNHLREYNIMNDSLINHNKLVVDLIMSGITKENDESLAKERRVFFNIALGLILISIIGGAFLFFRNKKGEKKSIEKDHVLISKSEKIGLLEEELKNNKFNDILELAKSNSPEFLPLFGEVYPEFIESMKQLDPSIRSSELYFCALAYLNFSTKDIANYTFVTTRAVQVRKNRLRKKHNIPSEDDFNQWFRNLENEIILVEEEVTV